MIRILKEARGFILHPNIPKENFDVTNNMADVKDFWKAKILVANSGGKKGDFDTVRYIMISLKDNTIIPIAIGDEHRTGYDLMYDYYQDMGVKVRDYFSFCSWGTNYLWDNNEKEYSELKIVGQKFIDWGGNPMNEVNINRLVGTIKDVTNLTLRQFIDKNTFKKGKITEHGEELIKIWKKLASEFNSKRGSMKKSDLNYLINKTRETMEKTFEISMYLRGHFLLDNAYNKIFKIISKEGTIEDLEMFIFGFSSSKDSEYVQIAQEAYDEFTGGVKNNTHSIIKKEAESYKKNPDWGSQLQDKIGDLEMIAKLFGGI